MLVVVQLQCMCVCVGQANIEDTNSGIFVPKDSGLNADTTTLHPSLYHMAILNRKNTTMKLFYHSLTLLNVLLITRGTHKINNKY